MKVWVGGVEMCMVMIGDVVIEWEQYGCGVYDNVVTMEMDDGEVVEMNGVEMGMVMNGDVVIEWYDDGSGECVNVVTWVMDDGEVVKMDMYEWKVKMWKW